MFPGQQAPLIQLAAPGQDFSLTTEEFMFGGAAPSLLDSGGQQRMPPSLLDSSQQRMPTLLDSSQPRSLLDAGVYSSPGRGAALMDELPDPFAPHSPPDRQQRQGQYQNRMRDVQQRKLEREQAKQRLREARGSSGSQSQPLIDLSDLGRSSTPLAGGSSQQRSPPSPSTSSPLVSIASPPTSSPLVSITSPQSTPLAAPTPGWPQSFALGPAPASTDSSSGYASPTRPSSGAPTPTPHHSRSRSDGRLLGAQLASPSPVKRAPSPAPPASTPLFAAPPSLIDFSDGSPASVEQKKQLEMQLFDVASSPPSLFAAQSPLLAVPPPTPPSPLPSPPSQQQALPVDAAAAALLPDLADLFEFHKLEALQRVTVESPLPAFFAAGGEQSLLTSPAAAARGPLLAPSSSSSSTGLSSAQRLGRIEEVYALGAELGRGTFGAVRVGISHATGRRYAVKQIQKSTLSADILQKLELEIEILRRVQHQNIVNLEAVFQTGDSVFLVAEIAEGGNLFARMKKMKHYPEKDAAVLVRNVCSALAYLHKLGIVHRDVKPENILLVSELSNSDVKLADFGLSRYFAGSASLFTRVGTPLYVAPEILAGKGYGPAVDMWAVGVLTYCLLSGKPPFPCHDIAVLYQHILAGRYSFVDPVWQAVSTQAKEFIRSLMQVEPALRLTADRALKHPWVMLPPGTLQPVQSFDQAVGKYLDLLAGV